MGQEEALMEHKMHVPVESALDANVQGVTFTDFLRKGIAKGFSGDSLACMWHQLVNGVDEYPFTYLEDDWREFTTDQEYRNAGIQQPAYLTIHEDGSVLALVE